MFANLKDLKGHNILATDGEIGKVDDFYFDDDEWKVRYVVVDTGGWLSGRKVLLSPDVLRQPEQESGAIPVNLTRQQVQDSPDIDTQKPVSRRDEERLRGYYGWPYYWVPGTGPEMGMGYAPLPMAVQPVPVTGEEPPLNRDPEHEGMEDVPSSDRRENQHLRSFDEVSGYRINADDGHIGKADDFIVETEKWTMLYMVVDTGGLFGGKKVLIAPSWIEEISWTEKEIDIGLKVETVNNSPAYDPTQPLDREFESRLYRHYGKNEYWE